MKYLYVLIPTYGVSSVKAFLDPQEAASAAGDNYRVEVYCAQTGALNAVAKEAYDVAVSKGFWAPRGTDGSEPCNTIGKLLLIHSEVSEAAEDLRKGKLGLTYSSIGQLAENLGGTLPIPKPEGLPSEIADILIRTLDLAHGMGIDVDAVVKQKMAYNKTRSAMNGGKKF